jgi:hypothetical protein
MNKMRNKVSLAIVAIALLGSVGYAATLGLAKADFTTNSPLVQALSERFGLNQDEVAEALDEIRADQHAEMMQNHEDSLNQAVENGVITDEQKQALLEKHRDMWDAKKREMETHRAEMDAWFAEQGIDHKALMQYMGPGPMGFHHHRQFGGGFGNTNSN